MTPRPDRRATQFEVLAACEELVEAGVLTGDPDPAADQIRFGNDVMAVDEHSAGCGPDQGREHSDQGGLAGAVVAQHAECRSGLDLHVDTGEGVYVAEANVHTLGDHSGPHPSVSEDGPAQQGVAPSPGAVEQHSLAAVAASSAMSSASTV